MKLLTRMITVAGGIGALAAAASIVNSSAQRSERDNPPEGAFVDVRGIRLQYLQQGAGPVVVLLHGNGVTASDWRTSGIIDELARDHRVIAFDRPGFGYSERPRRAVWTASAQAALFHEAFAALGITGAIVVGHSWGTMVAVALALDFPDDVRSLVLLSGYYFESPRLDAPIMGAPAIPIVGDALRHTISPLVGRLVAPLVIRQLFAPLPVDPRFKDDFSVGMALRPSQLRANAEDAALMIPSAALLQKRYGELRLPVTILAGAGDRIVNAAEQSDRLRAEVPQAAGHTIEGIGHMIHYAVPEQIRDAIVGAGRAPAAR